MQCARCGTENPVSARFCLDCGTPLAIGDTGRARREERKVVSALFADLVGFTAQADRLDPEEVRAILAPYHATVRADLERWGGTVEKFIGDAVMALFGAPVAREDDAERAVRAALRIRDTLTSEGRLHVRVGIATGEALVTLDARPDAGEGMAAGDVVNVAARLQGAAPVDGILVDEATARATDRAIEYRDHEPVAVQGKAEPIAVHEAVAARARFGTDIRHVGGAPLVGRVRELDLLVGAFERAKAEREPQLVTLVGVPGIGKSRLVWELFQHVDRGEDLVAWRQGRSLPYSERVSFWALSEIVKAETGVLETDDVAEAEARLDDALEPLAFDDAEADWVRRHLRPLLGLEPDAELHGNRLGEAFAAWRRFLEALAERRPLVVVFEDLHWADDGLLDFVDHLVDWAAGVPLLIVATSRPELLTRRPGWGGGKPNALTVSLSPLSESEATRLVANLVERSVIPDRVRDAVLERAQGNPLFAEEYARLIAGGDRLEDLPDTVQGIIAARLDSLPRDEKDLLQDAAVVGKVFWSGALREMRRRDRAEVETALHALERKEFVRRDRRSSVAGQTEYAFRHILVRDVAYGQIPRGDRADRHARAAAWIQALGRSADHAELLAGHWLAALELARAAARPTDSYVEPARAALLEAGDRALALNAFAGAARYLRVALDLMVAEDPERPSALFRYAKAVHISQGGAGEVLGEAEAGLRDRGDLATAAEAAVLQAESAWYAGDGAANAAHLRRAAEIVEGLPPSYSVAYVLSDLCRYQTLAGRNEEAIRVGGKALAMATAHGFDDIRAHVLSSIGTARSRLGDPAGEADLEEAIALSRAGNSPELARALNNLGSIRARRGQLRHAGELWREARQTALDFGNPTLAHFVRSNLELSDYAAGCWDDALRAGEEMLAEFEAGRAPSEGPLTRFIRAWIDLARDDVEGAIEETRLGLAAARRAGNPQDLVPALASQAALMLELGRADEATCALDEVVAVVSRVPGEMAPEFGLALAVAGRWSDLQAHVETMPASLWRDMHRAILEGDLRRAARICDDAGSLPIAARLRLLAAGRLLEADEPEAARSELAAAVDFWQSVGARYWLDRAAAVQQRIEATSSEATRTAP